MNTRIIAMLASIGLAVGAAAAPAAAGTAATNVNVNTVIANVCTISSPSAVTFTSFDGTVNTTSASAVSVVCTSGAPWTISADAGQNGSNATGTTRAMNNGTDYLSYEMYTDSARTTVWNGSNKLTGTGNGVAQAKTLYARLPAQTIPPAATYSDTVVATVTF